MFFVRMARLAPTEKPMPLNRFLENDDACPSEKILCAFDQGCLAPAEWETMAFHIESCNRCADRLRVLERPNRIRKETVPSRSSALTVEQEPGCAELQHRALALWSERSGRATDSEFSLSTKWGTYDLQERLGRGGMGVVYRAHQPSLDRMVAVKILKAGAHGSPEETARFRAEARRLARLQHPHIVAIFEAGEHDHCPYFVMELVEGGSLAKKLAGTPLSARAAAELILPLTRAIAYAHSQGIVHRDLKPSNVLLTSDGEPKVSDFGLSKGLAGDTQQTSTGAILGSPPYMAPEQAAGKPDRIGPRTDVYGLGALLYELIVGRPPFSGSTPLETLEQVRTLEPVPPRRLNPGVPRDLETVCLHCLRKEPEERYACAEDLAQDLSRFVQGQPVLAQPASRAELFYRWCRRNPALAAATGLATAALLAVTTVLALWAAREQIHRRALADSLDQVQFHLAENYLDQGVSLCERGEISRGLLWLARARQKLPAQANGLGRIIEHQLTGWSRQIMPLQACRDIGQPISLAASSPDGNTVWTISAEKSLRRWDMKRGQLMGPPLLLPAEARQIASNPSGRGVLAVCVNGTVQCWSGPTGNLLYRLPVEDVALASWGADDTTLVTVNMHGVVTRWNATTGRPRGQGFGPRTAVQTLTASADGRTVLTVSKRCVQFWDSVLEKPIGPPLTFLADVSAAAFSPDGRMAITACADRTTQLWDVASQKALGSALRHRSIVEAVAFGPDGRVLLALGHDRLVRIYRSSTGQQMGQPLGPAVTAGFTAEGRIWTAGSDGIVRIWGAALDRPVGQVLQHESRVQAVAFSPDGRTALTGSWDRRGRLWDVARGKRVGELLSHPHAVMAVAFDPNGRMALTVCWDGKVRRWDPASGAAIGQPLDHDGARVGGFAFSPEGGTILTGDQLGHARFWDAHTGGLRARYWAHSERVPSVTFSLNGAYACTGSEDGTARLWDVATAKPVGPVLRHEQMVSGVRFSPDGKVLITASWDQRVRFWDVTSGAPLEPDLRLDDRVTLLALSPDGTTILTASPAGVARLWNAKTRLPIGRPLVHDDEIVAATFDPSGSTILTASADHTARLWDAGTGKSLGPPLVHDDRVWTVAFSPDGRMALSGSEDHTARLWTRELPPPGNAESLMRWVEMLTGQSLDERDAMQALDATHWNERCLQLGESNAQPAP